MLKIRPIEDKASQERYSLFCGADYYSDSLAYSCYEDDTFVGICQFHLSDDKVFIDNLVGVIGSDDVNALFIMGRAALNFADLSGFHDAFYLNPTNDKLARMIGFKKDIGGDWYMDLRNFFDSPCSHDTK